MGGSSLNPINQTSDSWDKIKQWGEEIEDFSDDIDGTTARHEQERAAKRAAEQAAVQAEQADQANNRANQKTPSIAALLATNRKDSLLGTSGTLLTGPQGVSPGTVPLGRNVLLGR